MSAPHIFGVRHLSPAGAFHLSNFLNNIKPRIVLIEGPSDLTPSIIHMTAKGTKLPIAILAYTKEQPVRTILYPFAQYSPEYQAVVWAHKNKKECRFIDLPSSVFLAIEKRSKFIAEAEEEEECATEESEETDDEATEETEKVEKTENINLTSFVYQKLDELGGYGEHEGFWESTMEHTLDADEYHKGVNEFGRQLREITLGSDVDYPETIIRESFMRRQIEDVIKEGFKPEEIVIVTGAYHVEGLSTIVPMTDTEIKSLPSVASESTFMPYSYYRLSSRSGYGAGNKAPAYYDLIWNGFKKGNTDHPTISYLSRIAKFRRKSGSPVSSADVIEGVRLAKTLAGLNGRTVPILADLRDAAVTCIGQGSFHSIATAIADTETGNVIGEMPQGVSRTSIQNDFYTKINDLNLKRFVGITADKLRLDMREKLASKSGKSAFLDLNRSSFLHRLAVLNVSFAIKTQGNQENATWAEEWSFSWTPESEIQIVESALLGDTIEDAAAFSLKERLGKTDSISGIAGIIRLSFLCGMPEILRHAVSALQQSATEASSLQEISATMTELSSVISYGDIRKIDASGLIPILSQLYLRACMVSYSACVCDNNAVDSVIAALDGVNGVGRIHDFLDDADWVHVVSMIADSDGVNPKAAGFCTALQLERNAVSPDELGRMVETRLSPGTPAQDGTLWFEGLSMKNHYALIARVSLWETLSAYIDALDDEEYKRALVYLRRTFADYGSREKDEIARTLAEIWGLNKRDVSEVLNTNLTKSEKEVIADLGEFNFDDI